MKPELRLDFTRTYYGGNVQITDFNATSSSLQQIVLICEFPSEAELFNEPFSTSGVCLTVVM